MNAGDVAESLCQTCRTTFFGPSNDTINCLNGHFCSCCLGYFDPAMLDEISCRVKASMVANALPSLPTVVDVKLPPILEVSRVVIKTVLYHLEETEDTNSGLKFNTTCPSHQMLYKKMLGRKLKYNNAVQIVDAVAAAPVVSPFSTPGGISVIGDGPNTAIQQGITGKHKKQRIRNRLARQVYTATPHVGVTNEPEAVPETVEAGESNDPLCSTAQDTHNRNAFQLEHLSDEANTGIAGDVETSCENSNISNSEKGGSLVDGSICRHYNRPAPPKFHNQVIINTELCPTFNGPDCCAAIFPAFNKTKKNGRTFNHHSNPENQAPKNPLLVSHARLDGVLIYLKSIEKYKDVVSLWIRWNTFVRSLSESNSDTSSSELPVKPYSLLFWSYKVTLCPIYLLGRYTKHSRDIPQTPWTLNDADDEAPAGSTCASTDDKSAGPHRKGRLSVEERISKVVGLYIPLYTGKDGANQETATEPSSTDTAKHYVSCDATIGSIQMHGCGREDIDVRMLGTGRPFVLKVTGALVDPTSMITSPSPASEDSTSLMGCRMASIMRHINTNQPTFDNEPLDISLHPSLALHVVPVSIWESMQLIAEEKQKSYRCVVWCSHSVTQSDLNHLCQQGTVSNSTDSKSTSTYGDDEATVPSMKGPRLLSVIQKTPLRVLHRRSLLNRPRVVSNLSAILLTRNMFMLTLTTTAGTYVKEFVHGDFGRTLPNVGQIIQDKRDSELQNSAVANGGDVACVDIRCDIMQLDVVHLWDDFTVPGDVTNDNDGTPEDHERVSEGKCEVMSLEKMKNMPLVNWRALCPALSVTVEEKSDIYVVSTPLAKKRKIENVATSL